jgi:YidC/Oxa1 family membrane protein insertase
LEVVQRRNRTWWWVAGLATVMSVSGCSMYPTHPGMWPGGLWGSILQFVSSVIDFAAKHLGGDYGLALLVVTVIVRLIVLPLMIKQIRYQKVMQALQPEIQKIRGKHQGDNQKIQQETMKLWQQHGVNPMSGCFPMVIQLPILYALFGAIEGNVKLNHSHFLGIFNLGSPDHYYILPLAAAITTYFSSKLMMAGTDGGQQKMMLFIMPVFIFIIGSRFPSGLALYWVYTNLFQAVQTYFVKVKPAAASGAVVDVTPPPKPPSERSQRSRQKLDAGDSAEGGASSQGERKSRARNNRGQQSSKGSGDDSEQQKEKQD